MSIIKILFPALFSVLFFITYAQQTTTLRIDPDNANGGNVGELMDSVNYIPLETTKASLFGKIDKLILTSKYFFILDHSTDAILLFTRAGKFHSKISLDKWVKTSDKVSMGITDFTVNEKLGMVVVAHYQKQSNLYFLDFKGNLLKVNEDKVWSRFENIDENHFLMESYGDITDKERKLAGNCIITDNKIAVMQQFLLKHREFNFNWIAGKSITKVFNTSSAFYTRSYDYNAYSIDSNGIAGIYNFIFPLKYTLPKEFTDTGFAEKQQHYFETHEVIYAISDVFKVNNYLIFNINNPLKNNFIYNLVNGNLYSSINISTDSTIGYLPVFSGDPVNILAADPKSFYTSIPAFEIMRDYEAAKDKKPVYSPVMQTFFKVNNRQSNPILVQLRLKENI